MKGNPIAQNRWRYQSYCKAKDEPMESEWEQLKKDAIYQASKRLIRDFERFGTDDYVMKVFNCMNHKQEPIVITLEDARKNIGG